MKLAKLILELTRKGYGVSFYESSTSIHPMLYVRITAFAINKQTEIALETFNGSAEEIDDYLATHIQYNVNKYFPNYKTQFDEHSS